jgi:hypothetical protein
MAVFNTNTIQINKTFDKLNIYKAVFMTTVTRLAII